MRVFFFVVLAVLATVVLGWEKEDHEIFDLVGDLEAAEGKGTTFYSWLGVSSTASTNEIARAYRKKSMQLHPDKNPGVKGVHERFARLGVISTILRNPESRERYDFFYRNGVPKWRGTGYYYSRYRPGLGTVLVFLIILTSGMQYVAQKINYNKDLQRVQRFMREARSTAWGPKMVPLPGQKKVRVNLGGSPRYDEDGYPIPGKLLDMVVDEQNVYILDTETGEMHLLDESAATPAAVSRTWFLYLVHLLYSKTVRPYLTGRAPQPQPPVDEQRVDDESTSEVTRSGTATPLTDDDAKPLRAPTMKAGGKRRKTNRKK
ncbi:DnaJ-domain-containing protein [Fistulina hepatica ATCC 64428]|uniref:DnaJ-domain-containing protein n=1 Tax=Fistulina hepatica ATCC 64428 TaxID=1128425 RepID=A0A0D7A5U5_9AGAR|nr:DnaJ-domain-containing protein [Fistulina hepatica ATCC 64428]